MEKDTKSIIRLISSVDHSLPRNELLEFIRNTGTDKHDPTKQMLFQDYYQAYSVDFFGSLVYDVDLETTLNRLCDEFKTKTLSDRKRRIVPDIAIIYDSTKCKMIKNVYEGLENSDCFQFIATPLEALKEVRELEL